MLIISVLTLDIHSTQGCVYYTSVQRGLISALKLQPKCLAQWGSLIYFVIIIILIDYRLMLRKYEEQTLHFNATLLPKSRHRHLRRYSSHVFLMGIYIIIII